MKQSEILELVRAGYSKAEIDAMDSNQEAAAEASGEKSLNDGQASKSDEARPAESGQDPTTEDPNKDIKSWLTDIKKSIDDQIAEIKKIQQETNVKTYNVGEDPFKQRTTKDVFKEVYQPQVFNVEEE